MDVAASPGDCCSWRVGRRRGLCPCRMCTVLLHIVAAQRISGVHATKQCTVCALSMQGKFPHHPGPPPPSPLLSNQSAPAPATPMPAQAPAATTQYATAQPSLPVTPTLPPHTPLFPAVHHPVPQALALSALCLRPGVAQACTSQSCACHPYLRACSAPACAAACLFMCCAPWQCPRIYRLLDSDHSSPK